MKDTSTPIDGTLGSNAPSKEVQSSGQTRAQDADLALMAARHFMDRYPAAMRRLAQ